MPSSYFKFPFQDVVFLAEILHDSDAASRSPDSAAPYEVVAEPWAFPSTATPVDLALIASATATFLFPAIVHDHPGRSD